MIKICLECGREGEGNFCSFCGAKYINLNLSSDRENPNNFEKVETYSSEAGIESGVALEIEEGLESSDKVDLSPNSIISPVHNEYIYDGDDAFYKDMDSSEEVVDKSKNYNRERYSRKSFNFYVLLSLFFFLSSLYTLGYFDRGFSFDGNIVNPLSNSNNKFEVSDFGQGNVPFKERVESRLINGEINSEEILYRDDFYDLNSAAVDLKCREKELSDEDFKGLVFEYKMRSFILLEREPTNICKDNLNIVSNGEFVPVELIYKGDEEFVVALSEVDLSALTLSFSGIENNNVERVEGLPFEVRLDNLSLTGFKFINFYSSNYLCGKVFKC